MNVVQKNYFQIFRPPDRKKTFNGIISKSREEAELENGIRKDKDMVLSVTDV